MWWGLFSGLVGGLALWGLRDVYVPWFTADPEVRRTLAAVLIVAALWQPVNGVVFVLDGVLIGAGDGPYLAVAGVIALVLYVPLALAVLWLDGGDRRARGGRSAGSCCCGSSPWSPASAATPGW